MDSDRVRTYLLKARAMHAPNETVVGLCPVVLWCSIVAFNGDLAVSTLQVTILHCLSEAAAFRYTCERHFS